MTEIITKLADRLLSDIKAADEIWIAVALMSNDGLSLLLDNLKDSCKQNYLIGVDLPTDPKALKKLNELQFTSGINVRIHTDKEYFHPKLYLIKNKTGYSAFIGSANCTNGGFFNNVELTINFTDSENCELLKLWFSDYYTKGKSLTTSFVENYQTDYLERQAREKGEENIAKKEKKELNDEIEAILSEKNDFVKVLKNYRKKSDYLDIVHEREQTIIDLRRSIDYPHFNNIDIESYFSYEELGHLIPIAKPAIKRHIPELKKLLHWLCDESVDIAIRYENSISGDLKVEGVAKAFISKILIAHRPDLYFVKNNKSEKALRKYGVQLPRGLTEGEKYKIMCNTLRQICKDTEIKDLAILDYYLYLEGNINE